METGRKTGFTVNDTGHRDGFGMEDLENFFSPEKTAANGGDATASATTAYVSVEEHTATEGTMQIASSTTPSPPFPSRQRADNSKRQRPGTNPGTERAAAATTSLFTAGAAALARTVALPSAVHDRSGHDSHGALGQSASGVLAGCPPGRGLPARACHRLVAHPALVVCPETRLQPPRGRRHWGAAQVVTTALVVGSRRRGGRG